MRAHQVVGILTTLSSLMAGMATVRATTTDKVTTDGMVRMMKFFYNGNKHEIQI